MDADINPLVPLSEYIENNDDFVTCLSATVSSYITGYQFNPHFILSKKNNYILKYCIDKYIDLYTNHKKSYSYWRWSICSQMNMPFVKQKKSQIILLNNQKYKFLLELNDLNTCVYNGKVVLHNRYDEYINHDFV